MHRKLLPLALISANDGEPIEGRTRLQKMVFLMQKELEQHGDAVVDALQQVEAAGTEAAAEFEDVPLGDVVREKAVTSRTWDLVGEDVQELLEAEFPVFAGVGDDAQE